MSENKWADFVISAVKRGSSSGRITQVQIHKDLGKSLSNPEIVDKMVIDANKK